MLNGLFHSASSYLNQTFVKKISLFWQTVILLQKNSKVS